MKNVQEKSGKKVFGICGSPKMGNSWWMLKKAANTIEEIGGSIECIHLNDHIINWCDGCLICEETGTCEIDDEMESIIDKIVASHSIIISTPVYFNSIPGRLKCFIDRLNPLLVDDRLNGKKLAVFIVGQLSGKEGKESRNDVKKFFSSFSEIFNMNIVGIIEAEGRLPDDLKDNKKVASQCEDICRKIISN